MGLTPGLDLTENDRHQIIDGITLAEDLSAVEAGVRQKGLDRLHKAPFRPVAHVLMNGLVAGKNLMFLVKVEHRAHQFSATVAAINGNNPNPAVPVYRKRRIGCTKVDTEYDLQLQAPPTARKPHQKTSLGVDYMHAGIRQTKPP